MAKEIPGFSYTLEASGDLSANQFQAIVVNASGEAAIAGADVYVDGVLQNDPSAQGRAAQIVSSGITKFKSGAAVTRGSLVTTDATGRAVDAVATDVIVGRALEAAANANEIISVLLGQGVA